MDPFITGLVISAKLKPGDRDYFNDNYEALTDMKVHTESKHDFIMRIAEISMRRKREIVELNNKVIELKSQLANADQPPENKELETEVNSLLSKLEVDSLNEVEPMFIAQNDRIEELMSNVEGNNDSLNLSSEIEEYENMFVKILEVIPQEIKDILPEDQQNNPLSAIKALLESGKEPVNQNIIELKPWEMKLAESYYNAINDYKPGLISSVKQAIVNYVFIHVLQTGKPPYLLPKPETVKKIREQYEE